MPFFHDREKAVIYSSKIFREYDIRGVFEKDFSLEFPELLAEAYVQILKKHFPQKSELKIAVGRDARPSGDALFDRFSQTLQRLGVEVWNLGIVPTPLVYFTPFHYPIEGAVSITASHNPAEYNGFKLCLGQNTLFGEKIQELLTNCEALKEKSKKELNPPKKGREISVEIIPDYLEAIFKDIDLTQNRKLKVVVDSGNGTGGLVGPKVLQKAGCEVIELFSEPDGTFPNHHPDPTEFENLKAIQKAIQDHQADLGIAYDGDADRIVAIDEKAQPLFGDELLVLFAREILNRKKGAKIISEVKCSARLYEDIEKHHGEPIMWKAGHSVLRKKLQEEKAELAGELSGHIFFSDRYYGFDDAIYASLRLIEILSKTEKPLSELVNLPKVFHTPEIRTFCEDEKKFEIVKKLKTALQKYSKDYRVIDIDGIRLENERAWGLIRASNTQPALTMRFEAKTKEDLEKIQKLIEDELEKAKY